MAAQLKVHGALCAPGRRHVLRVQHAIEARHRYALHRALPQVRARAHLSVELRQDHTELIPVELAHGLAKKG